MMPLDAQIGRLLSAYFEGTLEGEPFDALEAWINADASHAAMLIEHATLGRLLGQHYKMTDLAKVQESEENSKLEIRNSNFHLRRTTAANLSSGSSFEFRISSFVFVAALVVLALTAWFIFTPEPRTLNPEPSTPSAPVAVLMQADDVVWASAPQLVGENLSPQVMRLESGTASVQFYNGARVTVVGPAEFAIDSPGASRLNYGRLQAEVPGSAAGFVVHTPHFDVVDLGTAFSVQVDRAGHGHVTVLQGVVEVHSGGRSVRLTADQQIRYAAGTGLSLPLVVADAGAGIGPPIHARAAVAVSGLHLASSKGPGSTVPRSIFTQTFPVDPTRTLVGVECSTASIQDSGKDAEFGIYAITLTSPIGAAQSASLFARLNRDTIAAAAEPPADGGWRKLGEWFDYHSFPKWMTAANAAAALTTDDGVVFRFASPAAPARPDTWIIKLGAAEAIDIEPGSYSRLSILHSAVGFNPVGKGANNGMITLRYEDGSVEKFEWDVVDSNGVGVLPATPAPQPHPIKQTSKENRP